jgi:D-alanyl-lipoteichoic acid acyltransferase DltB (MBOAT superfamily)
MTKLGKRLSAPLAFALVAMTFTTLTYLLFLPLVFAIHWSLRSRSGQNSLLLACSYLFYGWWDWRFCALMLGSSLVDYFVGIGLDSCERLSRRRTLLAVSLATNLGLLGVFKYFNFFAESFQSLASQWGWEVGGTTLHIILPVGISFYTFQTLGYTIDVYRRHIEPSRNLIDYLAFVSFFPQLVAGPIERASAMLPQFAAMRRFDFDLAGDGCRQILWGFAKKLIIADRLAVVVDPYYAQPDAYSGPQLMLATVFFAFQIYCDFSAYSDIAIGTAKLFGIRLMRNFAYPYFSLSVSEFWRRWHISLSTWFRDYVFIPLGGSRCSPIRRTANLLLTFLVSGLWHGAAWRFVIWGGVNGMATAGGISEKPGQRAVSPAQAVPGGEANLPRPTTLLRIGCTFAIICSAWVFFRAHSLGDALLVFESIGRDVFSASAYQALVDSFDDDRFMRKTAVLLLAFVVFEWSQRRHECPLTFHRWPVPMRWTAYSAMLWMTLYWMPQTGGQEFIYFEF